MSKICTEHGCTNAHQARGYCRAHYYQWRKNAQPDEVGSNLAWRYPDPVERFWAQVGPRGDGCWEWTGTIVDGYGLVTWEGKQRGAHRVSWVIAHGPIPAGEVVRHRCDNRSCVRPDHLQLGSVRDNVLDMWERGNPRIPALRGSQQNGSKLVEQQAADIRRLRGEGVTVKELARKYGVSESTIYKTLQRKRWIYVE